MLKKLRKHTKQQKQRQAERGSLLPNSYQSESQRLKIGRKNLRYSARLSVFGLLLLGGSVAVGASLLKQSPDSQAASYYYTVVGVQNPPSTMYVGQTALVTYTVRNDGSATWYGEGSSNPTRLATWGPQDRSSAFYSEDGNWLYGSRIRMQQGAVAPGQLATFQFVVTARAQGSYQEQFNLVTDGIAWHTSRGIYFNIYVPPITLSYEPVSAVNPPATMETYQRASASITVRNTGTYVWHGEGSPNPVRLGASNPNDRASNFAVIGQGWISPNRIKLANPPVYPGQNAVFNFTVEAPEDSSSGDIAGDYLQITERFNVVADGKGWMPERGLFFTVNTKAFLPDKTIFSCQTMPSILNLYKHAEVGVYGGITGTLSDISAPGNCRVLGLYGNNSYVRQTFTIKTDGLYESFHTSKGRAYENVWPTVLNTVTVKNPDGTVKSLNTQRHTLSNSNYASYGINSPLNNTNRAFYKAGTTITLQVTFVNDLNSRDVFVDYFGLRPIDISTWNANVQPRTIANIGDTTIASQVHVIYAVPTGGVDRGLDKNGAIRTSLKAANNWLYSKMGKKVRYDQANGNIEVQFVRLPLGPSAYADRNTGYDTLKSDIKYLVATKPNVRYLIFAEVAMPGVCGLANFRGQFPTVYLHPNRDTCASSYFATNYNDAQAYPDLVAIHELVHSAGYVKECAPHFNESNHGHVTDDKNDLMGSAAGNNLDNDRADYVGGVAGTCRGFAHAPFLY